MTNTKKLRLSKTKAALEVYDAAKKALAAAPPELRQRFDVMVDMASLDAEHAMLVETRGTEFAKKSFDMDSDSVRILVARFG